MSPGTIGVAAAEIQAGLSANEATSTPLLSSRTPSCPQGKLREIYLFHPISAYISLVPEYRYYVYITTNKNKTTLYIGVTNNISRRLMEHSEAAAEKSGFAGKYRCHNLVYCEIYDNIADAITREKEIKKWRREKKNRLIETQNPEWRFMNDEIL